MDERKDDVAIIQSVLDGNRQQYAVIVRRYEVRVRGYCRAVLADPDAADDAAQEIFMKAYLNLVRFRGDSAFGTWLYRIAANHCRDLQRQKARRREQSLEKLLEESGGKNEKLLSAENQGVLKDEQEARLKRLFSKLPEKSREILTLRELQALSYQEIAEILKCSLDAVKSRLKRARRELEAAARMKAVGEHEA